MNVVPVLIIVFSLLTFESLLLGQSLEAKIAPYKFNIDTSQRDCSFGDFACPIGNVFRPVLGAIAGVANFLLLLGAAAAYEVPGAPLMVSGTLTAAIDVAMVFGAVALVRGLK